MVAAFALVLLATSGTAFAEDEEATTTTYRFGGYAKFDAMFSDYSDATPSSSAIIRQFYIPSQIPVGDGSLSGDVTADFQARESRLFFRADTKTASGSTITAYFEMDFFTHSDGNETVTNSYSPRLRHAFLKYDKWLFGQTWSTFQDVSVLPENLDFIGPAESTTFIRQAQIRYTSGNLELAVENPETFVSGTASPAPGHDTIPDLVARYTFKMKGGSYIKAAGLFRSLNVDEAVAKADETAYAVSASAKFMLGKNDIRAMVTYGDGVGRYLGLGIGRDANYNVATGNLDTIKQTAFFVSYRHRWSDQWRSNFTYGSNSLDIPASAADTTESASSFHVNLIRTIMPKLEIGAELMFAQRELVSGTDGDFTRLLLSAKYAF
jgi:hypothetical protein